MALTSVCFYHETSWRLVYTVWAPATGRSLPSWWMPAPLAVICQISRNEDIRL